MKRLLAAVIVGLAGAAIVILPTKLAAIGASALLHPIRMPLAIARPAVCSDENIDGVQVRLAAWRCRSVGASRGTIVYLHGVADTRASSVDVIQRFTSRGFDVVAYDSRAHGASDGRFCTYGFYEKADLARVVDTLRPGPIVLLGSSLGAAVALQYAAMDRRVSAVVAADTFSDLRTVASERAPLFFSNSVVGRAFRIAEEQAQFSVDAVSPVRAARHISAPVLLIHGADDVETPPAHSRRVFEALQRKKRLIIVPGAGHSQSLRSDVWPEIEKWIDDVIADASSAEL